MARTTFGVAENSQHLYGRALDVYFESRLAEDPRALRTNRLHDGGEEIDHRNIDPDRRVRMAQCGPHER